MLRQLLSSSSKANFTRQLLFIAVALVVVFIGYKLKNLDTSGLAAYHCEDGRYTVLFPPNPLRFSRELDSSTSAGHIRQHWIETEQKPYYYRAWYCDLKPEYVRSKTPAHILKEFKDIYVNQANSKPTAETSITIDSHPAIALTANTADGMAFKMRLILARNRLYLIMVGSKKEHIDNDLPAKVIESLSIITP